MELGIHLPLMQFGDEEQSLDRLVHAVAAARDCGFATVCANDHFLFQTPWLDGLTALAAVIDRSGAMELATTVSLVALRGPDPRLHYPLPDAAPAPAPLRRGGVPVWIGSWGSAPGLRRVARLGDGWLASAYNTTPERFAAAHAALGDALRARG